MLKGREHGLVCLPREEYYSLLLDDLWLSLRRELDLEKTCLLFSTAEEHKPANCLTSVWRKENLPLEVAS